MTCLCDNERVRLARWETQTGKYWVELYTTDSGVSYASDNGGGSLGKMPIEEALVWMQARVTRGDFLPDRAKRPMRRVF